jgi:hypothetical protein
MTGKGYWTAWTTNNIAYDLPQNCLWKPNSTQELAMSDLTASVAIVNTSRDTPLTIIRCIVLQNQPWIGLPRVQK